MPGRVLLFCWAVVGWTMLSAGLLAVSPVATPPAAFAATEFYADIVGAPGQPAVDRALEELGFYSKHLRILGSYGQARERG